MIQVTNPQNHQRNQLKANLKFKKRTPVIRARNSTITTSPRTRIRKNPTTIINTTLRVSHEVATEDRATVEVVKSDTTTTQMLSQASPSARNHSSTSMSVSRLLLREDSL